MGSTGGTLPSQEPTLLLKIVPKMHQNTSFSHTQLVNVINNVIVNAIF